MKWKTLITRKSVAFFAISLYVDTSDSAPIHISKWTSVSSMLLFVVIVVSATARMNKQQQNERCPSEPW